MLTSELLRKGVLTKLEALDKYPRVARPCVVLVKLLVNPMLLMKFSVPNPKIVDVSSVGSMYSVEIRLLNPMVVLWRVLAT